MGDSQRYKERFRRATRRGPETFPGKFIPVLIFHFCFFIPCVPDHLNLFQVVWNTGYFFAAGAATMSKGKPLVDS